MDELRTGRVIRVDAKVVHVDVEGKVIHAAPRGALFESLDGQKNPIAVGDFVKVSLDGDPVGVEEVLPRRNYLGRTASSHDPREQVLVANADQLFVVNAVRRPEFSSHRTDRILAACEWHEIPAVLIINKVDLGKPGEVEALRRTYASIPIDVIETCAKDGRGVDELMERMRGKVSVFYGPSGAGKSTLVNRIQPDLKLREGKISNYWKQGRHTTSFSQLHPLDIGGYVIDTPGIRVFRLYDVKKSVVRDLFPDFVRLQSQCRFPSCTHDHEPDCAVSKAVDDERLAETRYSSYLELLDEASEELPDIVDEMEGPPPE
jgi:ribosome biogenesis GTPase / thiamine phosphate phosphatase